MLFIGLRSGILGSVQLNLVGYWASLQIFCYSKSVFIEYVIYYRQYPFNPLFTLS